MLKREGHPEDEIRYYRHRVTPEYFSALGIPLLEGRYLNEQDRAAAPMVAVVSHTFARKLWPQENAVGRTLFIGGAWIPVAGVVGDVHYRDLTTSLMDPTNDPDLYLSFAQRSESGSVDILIRTTGDPSTAIAALHDAVKRLDPSLALYQVEPLEDTLARQTGLSRLTSSVLALFGVLSLVLAAIGLYGVMSFVVRGRRREIAIRSAIGANPAEIRSLVLGQGMRVVMIGLVLGLIGAAAAGRLLAGVMFGVRAVDPLVLGVTMSSLLAAALLANWLPAREAMRVAPQSAMALE
jgi:ABC-type antimicrobial peptide transport system permease subunit